MSHKFLYLFSEGNENMRALLGGKGAHAGLSAILEGELFARNPISVPNLFCIGTTPGIFGGHRGGKLYGRLDCRAALQAIARGGYVRHRVFFADEATAIAAGYRPCAVCLPQAYASWNKARKAVPRTRS